MIRSMRCLMMWYLCVKRLSEWWLRRWSHCVSRLGHHQLKKCGLKPNTLWPELRNFKLRFFLLKPSLRVHFTFHLSYLDLLLYSEMCLSLSPGLCWWSFCPSNPRTIGGLLKFHPPHRQIIIRVITTKDLKICLSAQINPDILEHSSEKATIGEHSGRPLATWDHVHHHQVP